MPQPPLEEPPAQELARLRTQFREVLSVDDDGDHPGPLDPDVRDPQRVPQGLPYRNHGAVPDQQDGDHGVGERPEPGGRGQIGPGELVSEGEGGGEVDEQVHPAPGFVRHPSAYRPGGGHADRGQEDGPGRGGGERGVTEQLPDGGDHVDSPVHGVSEQGEEPVPEDEQQDVPAAEGVPAGEPVGADPVLHGRYPGHQEQQHQHPVPGEQAGQVRGGGEQRVGPGRGPHLRRPEQGHHPRTG